MYNIWQHRDISRESHIIYVNMKAHGSSSWLLDDDAQVTLMIIGWIFQMISMLYHDEMVFNNIQVEYKIALSHVNIALIYTSSSTFNTMNYLAIWRPHKGYYLKFTLVHDFIKIRTPRWVPCWSANVRQTSIVSYLPTELRYIVFSSFDHVS